MKPTKAQAEAYQKIFDHFNQMLFGKQLPECMLNFGKHRGLQTFTAGKWREMAGFAAHEISLNMKQMTEGEPVDRVMASLVRQMVHLWQEMYGKPASSKWYFNREWAAKMEEVGLIPTDTGLPGGKKTGQGIRHCIEPDGRFAQAVKKMPAANLWPFRSAASKNEKDKGYSMKEMYRCTGCGAKVWGKGGLEILCGCGEVFAGETGDPKVGLAEKIYKILEVQYG